MPDVALEQIKELRVRTGISVMQCKKALEEAGGDMEKALVLLRKSGSEVASRKKDRELASGVITSYIHAGGRIGVLVELLCETDFVARNEGFRALAGDIAMHIAAMDPQFLRASDIGSGEKERVAGIFEEEASKLDKPAHVRKQIVAGKTAAYFNEKTLLEQPFVKDQDITVAELIDRAVQKIGERIEIGRFVRYALESA